jgi:diaminohydroxyphosphoribosylaminopyrimidine deaminase/5-amino-6-(5-phosphoribosylamino)uracil reductase
MNVRGINTPRQPIRVLIDSFLEVPLHSKILDENLGGHTIIFCGEVASSHFAKMEKELKTRNVSLVQLADTSPNTKGKVDLPGLFRYLANHLHINEVHVEAGFKLNGSLLREKCVDELLLYIAPKLVGEGLGLANLPELTELNLAQHWRFTEQVMVGEDLRLRLIHKDQ